MVESNDDAFVVVGEERRTGLYGQVLSSVGVERQLVDYFPDYVETGLYELLVNIQFIAGFSKHLIPFLPGHPSTAESSL